jgi:hypothetical protein
MSIKLTLAVMASLVLPTVTLAQGQAMAPQKLNAVLCKTEAQAIAFASSMAGGQTEPMAVNVVNRCFEVRPPYRLRRSTRRQRTIAVHCSCRGHQICGGRQACLDGELSPVQRRKARAGPRRAHFPPNLPAS